MYMIATILKLLQPLKAPGGTLFGQAPAVALLCMHWQPALLGSEPAGWAGQCRPVQGWQRPATCLLQLSTLCGTCQRDNIMGWLAPSCTSLPQAVTEALTCWWPLTAVLKICRSALHHLGFCTGLARAACLISFCT